MFTGMQMENRADGEVVDAAALRQQRRLKQAIRFLHRDSADLLPLDGLKKLGTSNQGQPHNILQKRLLEAKLARDVCGLTPNQNPPRTTRGVVLSRDLRSPEDEEDDDFIHVRCTCLGQEVDVLIDTGCKLNLMSSRTVEGLGLKGLVEEDETEVDGCPSQRRLCAAGHIEELGLTVGGLRVITSFVVVGSPEPLMSLGSRTLKSLKCVIDTDQQILVFGTSVRERVQFTQKPLGERSSDFRDLGY
ncbi:nuclear receptor-interacting protein 3-like [Cololabis saira]|uniref:nuclear receptor-interacting protein 3-like n=1 Tax=Cololabis saira TaxID=129043 RepID=UPI002AD35D9E|nr:nuclear receptor-interacting protein 3-like [Cololabis saira]